MRLPLSRFLSLVCLVGLLCLNMGAAQSALAANPVVNSLRLGVHGQDTRVVIDADKPLKYDIFMLGNPVRVVIDVEEFQWQGGDITKLKLGDIDSVRHGLFQAGTSRVVLDMTKPVLVKRNFTLPPSGRSGHRIVIDLTPANTSAFATELEKRKPVVKKRLTQAVAAPSPTALIPKKKKRAGPKVIVIDAGHGGVDPGTIGTTGVKEKNVTLAAAKTLKRILESQGKYKAVLTRSTDVYIPLRERVKIARNSEADLFISLHADAIKSHKVRGASVYTLSENASDREAAKLAAKENRSDIIAGVDLSDRDDVLSSILIDLAQRNTMNESATVAEMLVDDLSASARTLKRAHRFAGFAVLTAPDMPSVLIEMGFLSNRQDERFLNSRKGRETLMTSVAGAVDRFFQQPVN